MLDSVRRTKECKFLRFFQRPILVAESISRARLRLPRNIFFAIVFDTSRDRSPELFSPSRFWHCVALFGSAPAAFAQAVYGSIAGTVYDSSGAGVPKAAVTITDLQKNVNYATTTNESGNYSQTHLIVGRYRVKVELAGFKTAVQENVDLAVDTVTTVDVTLQPGDMTQTIERQRRSSFAQDRAHRRGHNTEREGGDGACRQSTATSHSSCC